MRPDRPGPEEMTVRLEPRHADAILAALEWALNAKDPPLDLGPGIRRASVEEAGRRIESVADLYRQGIRGPDVS